MSFDKRLLEPFDGGESPEVMAARDLHVQWTLRRFTSVQSRQIRWLVPGFIPLRAFTLVAGVGGLGKSTWLLARAAELSRDGIDTIVISFEDTAAEIIRPRLLAAGADLDHVHDVILRDSDGLDTVSLPRDLDNLRRLVQSVSARLIIIDPIVAAIETSFDAHKDQHVRHVLGSLVRIAEEEDAAIAGVGHLNKAPSTDAYIRVANSVAFWNAARSVVLITEDGDDDESRLVAQRKANWARIHPVERHRLEEILLQDELDLETGDQICTSRIVFVEIADDVTGADVLAGKLTKTETAETLLGVLLADGDWHESVGVKKVLAAADFNDRLAQRAAKFLGVESERRGFPAATWWRLPVATPIDATTTPLKSVATVNSAQPSASQSVRLPVATDSEGDPDEVEKRVPVPGDPGFPLHVDTAYGRGHLTVRELEERLAMHRFVREWGAAA